jgi:ParB family chromosome partitioning protein
VVIPDHTAPAATGLGAPEQTGGQAPAAVPEEPAHAGKVDGAWFAELPLDSITPNPRQPREYFDDEALAELVFSIKEFGLLQPIVVRQVGDDRYELIAGERRWRASQKAGLDAIPAIVRETEDDKLLVDALLENLHRAQLHAIEEAAAYDQLLQDFGCTQEQLADRIGRSRAHVTNTLRLLKLPAELHARIASGVLSAGHARALLGLKDRDAQIEMAERVNAEGLSVRSVEELVYMRNHDEEHHGPAKPKGTKKTGPRPGTRGMLADLEVRLKDRFETSVSIALTQKKGKLIIEFAGQEDLQRILAIMAPGEERTVARLGAAESAEVPAQAVGETETVA